MHAAGPSQAPPWGWPAGRGGDGAAGAWKRWLAGGASALAVVVVVAVVLRSTTLALGGAEVALVVALAAWRLRVATLVLIPLSAVTAELFHSDIPVGVALGALLVVVAPRLASGAVRLHRYTIWVAALGGVLLVSYLLPVTSIDHTDWPVKNLLAAEAGLLALAVSVAVPPSCRALLRVLVLSGLLTAWYVMAHGRMDGGRVEALGLNPNYLGAALALPIVASVGLALRSRNPLWLAGAGACVGPMLATQSRGASLSALAGVVFLVLQGRARQWLLPAVATVLAALAALGSYHAILDTGAGNRNATQLAGDNAIREQVAHFAIRVALSSPWRGIGFGQFPAYAGASPDMGYLTAHDQYLLIAAESGLPALGLLLAVIWIAVKARASGDACVVRAVAITYAVSILFMDSLYVLSSIIPFWFCLGALAGRVSDPGQEYRIQPVAMPHGYEKEGYSRVYDDTGHVVARPVRVRQKLAFVRQSR